ncbi:MAG: hypothetical protein RI564_12585, partial [Gracilimonas sp.]|nr:hypothetical protein [Gracilimonas sp.]
DDPTAAKKLVQSAFEKIDHLVSHPKSGKLVEEIESSIYRSSFISLSDILSARKRLCISSM